MKICFSTLGCPDFTWTEIYSMAKDFGFDGIEVRGLGNEIIAIRAKPFAPENVAATVEKLKALHLTIPCLSSGCSLRFADKADENYQELVGYVDLAESSARPTCAYCATLSPAP